MIRVTGRSGLDEVLYLVAGPSISTQLSELTDREFVIRLIPNTELDDGSVYSFSQEGTCDVDTYNT